MSSTESVGRHDDILNDSWEELTYKNQVSVSPSPQNSTSRSSSVIERLLRDAQRESSSISTSSNVGSICSCSASPRSVQSLSTDLPPDCFEVSVIQGTDGTPPCEPNTDWVWDWSSRPEIVPPWASDHNPQPFKHPVSRQRTYSIRNSRLMQSLMVSLENLPLLILTHACTFILGAATMLVILRKYYKFAASAALDWTAARLRRQHSKSFAEWIQFLQVTKMLLRLQSQPGRCWVYLSLEILVGHKAFSLFWFSDMMDT